MKLKFLTYPEENVKLERWSMNDLRQFLGEEFEGQAQSIWASRTQSEQNARKEVWEDKWNWWQKKEWRI